jgi:hypothetical protein
MSNSLFSLCSLVLAVLLTSNFANHARQVASTKSPKVKVAVEIAVPGVHALSLVKPVVYEDSAVSGRVVVQVKVNRDGKAVPVSIKSSDPTLRSLADSAVRNSLFVYKPRHRQTVAVGTISYTFALTETTKTDLDKLVGQEVVLAGEFSLAGKFGPKINISDNTIYVVPPTAKSYSWGAAYDKLEGKTAVLVGKLRFRPATPRRGNSERPSASAPAYFYFEVETTNILPFNP